MNKLEPFEDIVPLLDAFEAAQDGAPAFTAARNFPVSC
jgi:hypothetical protein